MQQLDFLTIDWRRWKTNAYRNAVEFVLNTKQEDFYPIFEFTIETKVADELALVLHAAFESRNTFQINRGPLGGGRYFVEGGSWAAQWGMVNGCETKTSPPEIGEPVSFILRLTGAPGFEDLFTKDY